MNRRFWRWVGGGLLLAAAVCARAQDADVDPVVWSVKNVPASIAASGEFRLDLHADIQPGWHLYSLNEPAGGPIATEIGVAEGDPVDLVTVNEDTPAETTDPVFQHPLRFHLHNADFALRLKPTPGLSAGQHLIHVLARFQSCSDKVCMPPKLAHVDVTLNLVG